jgi:predicted LPLAT superfamily acyltransferase
VKNNNISWDGKSRGGAIGHRIFIFLIRYLGLRFAYAVLSLVVIYFILFAPKATRSLWQYYRQILGRTTILAIVDIYKHYFVFGQTIIDKLAVKAGIVGFEATNVNIKDVGTTNRGRRLKFDIPQYDEFMNLVNKNTGFITIGAHVGCWELASCFFQGYENLINIVMLDAEYQKIKNIISHHKYPYKIIPVANTDGDFLQTILNIHSALRRNEIVSFQGDRFTRGQPTFTADFMGNNANFPAGVFALTRKMSVPVIFIFVMRQRKFTYKIEFTFANLADGSMGDFTNDSLEKKYISALENIVSHYPHQWFNFYKFWN